MEYWKVIEPCLMKVIEVAIVIAIILIFWKRKQAQETWRNFASRHGFKHLAPETPRFFFARITLAFQDPGDVQGNFLGFPLRLQADIKGAGKNRSISTIMSVEIPNLPAGLAVYHVNTFLKITILPGAQDVKTGDSVFDKAFVVQGNDPADVCSWLNDSRRNAILRILATQRDLNIRNGCLRFERNQLVDDPAVLEKALECFAALIPHLHSR